MHLQIHGRTLELVEGDLTVQAVDALVNAANAQLRPGGGVDGAIHRAGGPEIVADTARRYPEGCPTGSAVISTGGLLTARYVIHAVGPVWRGGLHGEPELLASAVRTALEVASQHGCRSVALPAISCGIYGYPHDLASRTILTTARDVLADDPCLERVRVVLFGGGIFGAFSAALEELG